MGRRIVELDRLTARESRRRARRSVGHCPWPGAEAGPPWARFFADAGAHVTVYDGRSAGELAPAIAALWQSTDRAGAGPAVDPASPWASADLVATSRASTPTSPRPNLPFGPRWPRLVAARRADPRARPPWSASPIWCCDCAPARRSGVTGTKGKTTYFVANGRAACRRPGHPRSWAAISASHSWSG